MSEAPRPWNLVAELTYRCPLRCSYCSNPLDWSRIGETLDAAAWGRVMHEAAALGVVHVGLTGGEPTLRRDLAEIVAAAEAAGLWPHLVTAGTPIDAGGLARLRDAGLRSVQLSLQDVRADAAARTTGGDWHAAKLDFARAVRALGLPLVLNVVLHRHNLARLREIVALGRELDVERLELANVQLHGFALAHRDALLPTREQLDAAAREVAALRREQARPELLFVLPDWLGERPKPCMGGWAKKTIVVAPDGLVMPCHAARSIEGLDFWRVPERDLAACWRDAPGMNAFRGEVWMREPCRECPERTRDFGGCRCQAFALAGDASLADPACALSPARERLLQARDTALAAAASRNVAAGASAGPTDRNAAPLPLRSASAAAHDAPPR